jgi:IclR family pca regulon transcriptional regulator
VPTSASSSPTDPTLAPRSARSVDFVQSLERGLAVIRCFTEDTSSLTLSEVAKSTGLTRAAARRFLLTLVELGYMRSDGRQFMLSPKVLELGHSYLSSLALPDIALPHMRELVDEIHESSSIAVLDGDAITYVARVPTKRIMSVSISIGTRFPAHGTSMGRVLLAAQSDEWLDGYLSSVKLDPITRFTITDPTKLRSELIRIRRQGYALVNQELEEGLRSIALPIANGRGEVIAAINVSLHASRASAEAHRKEILPPLQRTASLIEQDLALRGHLPTS